MLKEEKLKMTMTVSLAAVAWTAQQLHNLLLTSSWISDFLSVASWTKPTWNHFKVYFSGQREINKLLKQKRKEEMNNASALFSVVSEICFTPGNNFYYAVWILKCYRISSCSASVCP